jgi:predicted acetyltransferase
MGAFSADLQLVEPNIAFKDAYLELVNECRAAQENYNPHRKALRDFKVFVEELQSMKRGENLKPGIVPMTTYWLWRDGGKIIGESRLRHFLNPELEIEGGHIGYLIRPSERRKGFGTLILALTMEKAVVQGLKRVLVTCDSDNLGSARIIEKNGGVLAGYAISPSDGKQISHYWIDLTG